MVELMNHEARLEGKRVMAVEAGCNARISRIMMDRTWWFQHSIHNSQELNTVVFTVPVLNG